MQFVKLDLSKQPVARGEKALEIDAEHAKVIQTPEGKKLAILLKDGKETIIYVMDYIADVVGEIVEKTSSLWAKLEAIFQKLPNGIQVDDKLYRLTQQKPSTNLQAKVFYAHQSDKGSFEPIMIREGESLKQAKNRLLQSLQEANYI